MINIDPEAGIRSLISALVLFQPDFIEFQVQIIILLFRGNPASGNVDIRCIHSRDDLVVTEALLHGLFPGLNLDLTLGIFQSYFF